MAVLTFDDGPCPVYTRQILRILAAARAPASFEEQRNGEWNYLEFLQVTSWITADIFMREIPGGTRASIGPAQLTCPLPAQRVDG